MLKKSVLIGVSLLSVSLLLQQSHSISAFIAGIQHGTARLASTNAYDANEDSANEERSKDQLLHIIQSEAVKRRIAPIEAKLDSVWKAIPGYNGLEVDIEKTYRLAESRDPKQEITYIMREIPPAIQLEDLGPNPVYKGNPMKPMVSLMINVAWGDEFLPGMLKTLEDENVHATFFFDGSWLKKNIETAKQIASKGHELSNHAYSHKNMSRLGRQKAVEEISKTQELLIKELGVTNSLFAPPSGDFDRETVQIASELKLKTILWTLDTVDWTNPGAARIINKVSTRVEPGTLILMHPTVSSSQALKGIISVIKQKGYVLGTVSEVLSSKRVQLPTDRS